MRLQRFLARSGVASRRGSEDLMTAGRVSVNGQVVRELGTKVDSTKDVVTVDGVVIEAAAEAAYLMLNKPSGFLTTMKDPQDRPCVASLVPRDQYPGLFPVGRLDKDTTGLLLFSTDGDFAQAILHPKHYVWKTYEAIVDGLVQDEELDPLREGILLDDGRCAPACCHVEKYFEQEASTLVEIKIHEGRKNQVKRMLARIGHPVLALHRSYVGCLGLGDLRPGSWRMLTREELDLICIEKGAGA
ncbi:rRNA pseudouridine synthase [Collinsella sp. AGMB00827]|uniref:Pseudouridine synthase n=2 Tax=Collinsella ureilytica TaxID=2869515 RepID=A0ABS7MLS4_9ACTN|nr:rRNA pseudouridine synthase [Collinsella urealyticum]